MKYMGLKLGPALKICNLVNRIKGRRHMLMWFSQIWILV